MSETVTGAALIAVPVLFNVGFTLLAQRFDYPDILRQPTHRVLARFHEGGSSLLLIWLLFALSAVLFAPLAVLLAGELGDAEIGRASCRERGEISRGGVCVTQTGKGM